VDTAGHGHGHGQFSSEREIGSRPSPARSGGVGRVGGVGHKNGRTDTWMDAIDLSGFAWSGHLEDHLPIQAGSLTLNEARR